MIYRELDVDGDFTLGKKTNFVAASDAVKQAIYTRLWLWQGEWWEDLQNGLPMMQRILGFTNTKNAADILIRSRIVETEGVLDVLTFDSSFDETSRKYSCSVEVNTEFGVILLEGVTF